MKIDDLLQEAVAKWGEAQDICPDRNKDAEEDDPGQGKQCKNEGCGNSMGWCEPSDCPRITF